MLDQKTDKAIEENWPKIQQVFHEKVGPAALAAAKDDDQDAIALQTGLRRSAVPGTPGGEGGRIREILLLAPGPPDAHWRSVRRHGAVGRPREPKRYKLCHAPSRNVRSSAI